MAIRAVLDTSALVPANSCRRLHEAANEGGFTPIWSPYIVAELNRVLTWLWLDRTGGDFSNANRRRCADAARAMMDIMLPMYELVSPLPPFPRPWSSLADQSDLPIWAAAKLSGAGYVVSENRRDYPPIGPDGWHTFEEVRFLTVEAFLSEVVQGVRPPT